MATGDTVIEANLGNAQTSIMVNKNDLVLIVDDNPDNLKVLFQTLHQANYKVVVANNGFDALSRLQQITPAIILLDILMPDMDGFELYHIIRDNPLTVKTPIIFLSALTDIQYLTQAFNIKAIDYITKPFHPQEVLARMEKYLVHQRLELELHEKNAQLEREIADRKEIERYLQQAYDEMQQRTAQLTVLNEISQTLAALTELPALLKNVVGLLAFLVQCDQVAMLLLNETQTELQVTAHQTNDNKSLSKNSFAVAHDCLAEQIIRSHQSVRLPQTKGFDNSPLVQTFLKESHQHSLLAVGLRTHDRVIGLLIMTMGQPHKRAFSHEEQMLMETIAAQIAGAIEIAHLLDETQRANKRLEELVNLDGLTGIANRRRFEEYLQEVWQKTKEPVSLILTDIDYFKQYNDHYGHVEGDICLQRVAQLLAETLPRPADFAARYGGEEFVIILPNTMSQQAIDIAENIQMALAEKQLPHAVSAISSYITLSYGIATMYPSPTVSPTMLIDLADKALYNAKAQGRNCVVKAMSPNEKGV